ncbi:hypothetical protein EXW45_05435 [Bacillus wiedmannii]|nr:hypothetical protein DN394_17080 [Bacillus sp. BB081]QWH70846.1 hypothetical protein EXW45_05435 [Bacillus wiedmannii]
MVKYYSDGSPIHIIKIKVVQVGGRHLWVSFFTYIAFFNKMIWFILYKNIIILNGFIRIIQSGRIHHVET